MCVRMVHDHDDNVTVFGTFNRLARTANRIITYVGIIEKYLSSINFQIEFPRFPLHVRPTNGRHGRRVVRVAKNPSISVQRLYPPARESGRRTKYPNLFFVTRFRTRLVPEFRPIFFFSYSFTSFYRTEIERSFTRSAWIYFTVSVSLYPKGKNVKWPRGQAKVLKAWRTDGFEFRKRISFRIVGFDLGDFCYSNIGIPIIEMHVCVFFFFF